MSNQVDEALRLAYLEAMGIDVWLLKPQSRPQSGSESLEIPSIETNPTETPALLLPVQDWESLQNSISKCSLCSLSRDRTQTPPLPINQTAEWLILTDAPFATMQNSDAGLLLQEMLFALNLTPADVQFCSALQCPPGPRNALTSEIGTCRPFLEQQLTFLQPKIILVFGEIAAQSLLQTETSLIELRGSIHKFRNIATVVPFHPEYLLRSSLEKRSAWQDLKLAKTAFIEVSHL